MQSLKYVIRDPGEVLVVDDERATRLLYRRILEPLGYWVREASNGEEALREVERKAPDVLLLDINMPVMNGFAACEALKNDPKTRLLPVIVVTTLEGVGDRVRAAELGADDFLNKPFFAPELIARVRSLVSLKRQTDELEDAETVLEGIVKAVEQRDAYTMQHSTRVGLFALRLGTALGLAADELEILRIGATFHDIGKIGVPDAALLKPGRLTTDEYDLIKRHPVIGEELCRPMRSFARLLPLIRHHHEKLDGTGYPDGLRGADISLPVRILSVSDVYDAISTRRSYRDSMPPARCAQILREEAARGWWDRDVVEMMITGVMPEVEPESPLEAKRAG